MAICKHVGSLFRLLTNSPAPVHCQKQILHRNILPIIAPQCSSIHTTVSNYDLMEFFDDKNNWGETEVKVGRSWRADELRIKSNSDLHKLWYILLKEKNMLLTMEHACRQNYEMFPNPERIDKVEESMENIETVVRERNRAYYQLETGETGERPSGTAKNCFGLMYTYRKSEHTMEAKFNTGYKKEMALIRDTTDRRYVAKFIKLYNERSNKKKDYQKRCEENRVVGLLKRFPDMDMEALRHHYPDVDIEKCKERRASRGNRANEW